MIEAHYYRTATGEVKRNKKRGIEPRFETLKEESGVVQLKVKPLLGDEKATVTKHFNRKLGLKYGMASSGASCTVTLTCGQNAGTIKKAGEAASKLAVEMLDEDMNIAGEWLEEIEEQLPEE